MVFFAFSDEYIYIEETDTFIYVEETDTFTSSVTGETLINHKLNCDDKCLIYLLTSKCCGKQYVGETTDEFSLRWNNYKSNDRKFV